MRECPYNTEAAYASYNGRAEQPVIKGAAQETAACVRHAVCNLLVCQDKRNINLPPCSLYTAMRIYFAVSHSLKKKKSKKALFCV